MKMPQYYSLGSVYTAVSFVSFIQEYAPELSGLKELRNFFQSNNIAAMQIGGRYT